jgi:hypothetical protein
MPAPDVTIASTACGIFHGQQAHAAELWLPVGSDWRRGLLGVAADLRALGMRTWSFWPPPHAETAEILHTLYVGPGGDPIFLGCCMRDGAAEPPPAARRLFYAMGDYDLT